MGQVNDDLFVNGQLSARTFVPSSGSVGGGAIKTPDFVSEFGIPGQKIQGVFREIYRNGAGKSTTSAVSETQVVHVAKAASTFIFIEAGAVTKAVGDSTVTVDLKKNGATILSAPISLTSAVANRATVAAVPTSGVLADGDVLEVTTVATVGTGTLPLGVFARVDILENPYAV
jgi:hypothetical protein